MTLYDDTLAEIEKRRRIYQEGLDYSRQKNYKYMKFFSEEINDVTIYTVKYYADREATQLLEEKILNDPCS